MSQLTTTSDKSMKDIYDQDALRLEAVTTCVGFDDLLDITLTKNHPHFDHYIVVTSHTDKATKKVCWKHGATCVPTDLFYTGGRNFNKGAAINSGMNYFKYRGFRTHIDCDIVLPDNFRRILFNMTHLERHCLYGMDRFNIVGDKNIKDFLTKGTLQHHDSMLVGENEFDTRLGHRLVHNLYHYLPLGFFQMWHASHQKMYPHSLGYASHDDMMFSELFPQSDRRLLPSLIAYHLVPGNKIKVGQNWEGRRGTPRLKLDK